MDTEESQPDEAQSLGANLARAREEARLTQEQVFERLGMKRRETVSDHERGKQVPRQRQLEAYASLYGKTVRELRYGWNVTVVQVPGHGVGSTPRVSPGLPYRVRVWLQSELTDYVNARVPEHLFLDARSTLESVSGFFVGGGGTAGKPPDEDILEEMKVVARAIRRRLRRGGAKLSADPVE